MILAIGVVDVRAVVFRGRIGSGCGRGRGRGRGAGWIVQAIETCCMFRACSQNSTSSGRTSSKCHVCLHSYMRRIGYLMMMMMMAAISLTPNLFLLRLDGCGLRAPRGGPFACKQLEGRPIWWHVIIQLEDGLAGSTFIQSFIHSVSRRSVLRRFNQVSPSYTIISCKSNLLYPSAKNTLASSTADCLSVGHLGRCRT